jgi:hypothetical protein
MAVALSVLGACRLGVPSLPKVETWTPGARAIVMPMRGSTPTDDQVAAVVANRLRQLGDVELLAPPPSATPVSNGDPHDACQQANALGAEYVVLAAGDISILDNKLCLIGTGVLSKIVLPLPIPIPIPIANKVAVVEVPLSLPDKCIFEVEIGDKWAVTANAQVFSTAQCLATGGQFAIDRGTNLTLKDGNALQRAIEKKTADLFPARATIKELDGEKGVVVAPKGLARGDVYEVRSGPYTEGSLGYVRSVDRERAIIEPYEPTDRLQRGDLLLRRGWPLWMEFLAYGASSQLSVDRDRHLAAGGGGLFRGQFGWFSLGLNVDRVPAHPRCGRASRYRHDECAQGWSPARRTPSPRATRRHLRARRIWLLRRARCAIGGRRPRRLCGRVRGGTTRARQVVHEPRARRRALRDGGVRRARVGRPADRRDAAHVRAELPIGADVLALRGS